MTTSLLNKKCEVCGQSLPDDFNNLLCYECYYKKSEENEKIKIEKELQQKEEILKNPQNPTHPNNAEKFKGVHGILDPNYKTNPEMEDKDQVLANLAQFIYSHDPAKGRKGKLLWYPTRNIYNFIKNYARKRVCDHPQYPKQIWKPHIVDVGCGIGVGSNVMSQEAHFVWGIDKNEFSIEFAKEAFERERNNIYYSGQLTFDVFDVMVDSRLTAQFDFVVCVEVIEHIEDTDKFIKSIIRFARKNKNNDYHIPNATEFFISSPNRNNPKIRKDQPANLYHIREWTSQEFYNLLLSYFEKVELLNQKGEILPIETQETPILAKCLYPKW